MTKTYKAFIASLVVVLVVLAPACRSSRKKNPGVNTTTTAAGPAVPDVADVRPVQPTDTAATVTDPRDFVRETGPTEEVVPTNIEELNRWAQERGYVRDAFFPYAEAALDADAQAALTASADWLRRNTAYGVLIEGHCDERGTEQFNLALGDRRANIAREFLMTLGIDGTRIRTVSYGEERPFEEGHNESAWAQNRRAHLVLTR